MKKIKIVAATLAMSLAMTGGTLAAQRTSRAGFEANAQAIGPEVAARAGSRVEALHQCNQQVDKFKDYTWGEQQSLGYRACMAQHGQPE